MTRLRKHEDQISRKGAFIGSWGLNGEGRSLAGELIKGGVGLDHDCTRIVLGMYSLVKFR